VRLKTTLSKPSTYKNNFSIVFSCWTRSLDIVAHYCSLEDIKVARIDGTFLPPQRQKMLDNYCTDGETRILLMTTGTGAVGYDTPHYCYIRYRNSDTKHRIGSTSL
jgi:SNF2 family DNA or RNA helicase